MKLLTFLGVANYEETTYVWGEAEYTTRFAPAASCHFLKPNSVITFLTEEAQQKVFDDFKKSLPQDIEVNPQPVPLGSNQQQLWQIFQTVTDAVKPGDEVAFDITHGLRSFPLIGLLVAVFLRFGRNVSIKRILYGAFDVRDKAAQPPRTPMFDLTSMLILLEWAAAADRFAQTGDARPMAQLLDAGRSSSRTVKKARETLTSVSLAALLCQPFSLSESAERLEQDLQDAQVELNQPALPFNLLRQRVVEVFSAFAAKGDKGLDKVLNAQLKLIEWYSHNNQLIQAMTLAREWMINAVIFRLGNDFSDLNEQEREKRYASAINSVERAARSNNSAASTNLNAESNWQKLSEEDRERIQREWSEQERETLIELSRGIQSVRNTLAHAGHKSNAMTPQKISKKAEEEVLTPLRKLAAIWDLD